MGFFGNILEKLGLDGKAENPTTGPTSATAPASAANHRPLPRLPSLSPSSMSSHNWSSAQRLTRRNLTGAHRSLTCSNCSTSTAASPHQRVGC